MDILYLFCEFIESLYRFYSIYFLCYQNWKIKPTGHFVTLKVNISGIKTFFGVRSNFVCKDDSDYLAFKETTWSYSKFECFVYCSTFLCAKLASLAVPPRSQPSVALIQICCTMIMNTYANGTTICTSLNIQLSSTYISINIIIMKMLVNFYKHNSFQSLIAPSNEVLDVLHLAVSII